MTSENYLLTTDIYVRSIGWLKTLFLVVKVVLWKAQHCTVFGDTAAPHSKLDPAS